jgi:hypothetical protein
MTQPTTLDAEKKARRSLEEGADLSTDTKQGHGRDDLSTKPLVFVAEAPDARTIYDLLRQPAPRVYKHGGGRIATARRTLGVIEVQQHHSNMRTTCCLAWGQWGWFTVLRNYDACRQSTTSCRSDSTSLLSIIHNPSNGMVVLGALVYICQAILQYTINRQDYYQQLCLVIGLAAGLLLSPFVPSSVPGPPVSMHTLMATTSVALVCSAFGHWIWRKYFSTRETRLEKKLVQWEEEARCVVKDTHVVKFHELI